MRKIDNLGRVVLPIEARRKLDIKAKDPVEIFTDGDTIYLQKYVETCVFCGATDIVHFKDKPICRECIKKLIGSL